MRCKHFKREVKDNNVCAAFPDGIPREIFMNMYDHRKPYPGDHGIHFEPRELQQVETNGTPAEKAADLPASSAS
jgi:hypothetical protein